MRKRGFRFVLYLFVLLVLSTVIYAAAPTFINTTSNAKFEALEDQLYLRYEYGRDADDEYPLNFSSTAKDQTVNFTVFSMQAWNTTTAIINFTPTNADVGVYIFYLIVEDTARDFTTIRVYYNVTNVNDVPNITWYSPTNTNYSAVEGTYVNFSIKYVDVDLGDVNNVSWFQDGTLVANTMNWTASFPNFCDSGGKNVTVVVNDSDGATAYVYWNVTVNNSDRGPTFNGTIINFTWAEESNLSNVINLSTYFNDSDVMECGDSETWRVFGNSTIIVNINLSSKNVSFFVPGHWYGVERIYFNYTQNGNSTKSNNITLNVTNIPDYPNITRVSNQSAFANALFALYISAHDNDNDNNLGITENLTFVDNSTLFSITYLNRTTSVINFTPQASDAGTYFINITVSDGNLTDMIEFNLTVNSNTAPVVHAIDDTTATEAVNKIIPIFGHDDDHENITFTTNVSSINVIAGNGTNATLNLTPSNADSIAGVIHVKVTATDPYGATNYTEFKITVSGVNSPPSINLIQNQTVRVNVSFMLYVSAYDPEGDTLSFTSNDTIRFNISSFNSTTGLINVTLNDTYNGTNYFVNISVTDGNGGSDYQLVLFNVSINYAPEFVHIDDWLNVTNVTENSNFTLYIKANDKNNDNLTFQTNTSLFTLQWFNTTTALINFTPAKGISGIYKIFFNVSDGYEGGDNMTINLTILPFGNSPYFVNLSATYNSTENDYFFVNITAGDSDSDNLSFWTNSSLFPIIKVNNESGRINFTVNSSHIGTWKVRINITDDTYVNSSVVTFYISYINDAPNITWYYPAGTDNTTSSENTTQLFNHTSNDSDIVYGDTIYYKWFKAKLNNSLTDKCEDYSLVACTTGNGKSCKWDSGASFCAKNLSYLSYTLQSTGDKWTFSPGFTDSGNWSIKLYINDTRDYNDTQTWNITVNNTNRAPYKAENIPNLTWVNGLYCCIDLDTYLKDYDTDDTLTFTSSSVASFSISIDSTTHEVSFLPDTGFIGTAQVYFTLNDGYATANSNNVTLTVQEAEAVAATTLYQTVRVSSVSRVTSHIPTPVPVEKNVTAPDLVELVVPGPTVMYPNESMVAPITIKNTANFTITNITLFAETDNETNLSMRFLLPYIESLKSGEEINTYLVIESYTKKPKYEVKITAAVISPQFKDTAALYISSLESSFFNESAGADTKIAFVRDLLLEHPECLELNELLDQAENALDKLDYAKARTLIESAMQGCKYLISSERTLELPKARRKMFSMDTKIVIGMVTLFVLVFIASYIISTRKPKVAGERKK